MMGAAHSHQFHIHYGSSPLATLDLHSITIPVVPIEHYPPLYQFSLFLRSTTMHRKIRLSWNHYSNDMQIKIYSPYGLWNLHGSIIETGPRIGRHAQQRFPPGWYGEGAMKPVSCPIRTMYVQLRQRGGESWGGLRVATWLILVISNGLGQPIAIYHFRGLMLKGLLHLLGSSAQFASNRNS